MNEVLYTLKLFPIEHLNLLKPQNIYREFKRIVAGIGSPNTRFHDLRHSYTVAAIQFGDDIKTAQENLGHAAAAFTLDTYGHVNLSLTKTTEDGKNLSGWQFSIYSNSACTSLVSGPHTTDSSGKISVTGLKPGTYYVKEIGHTTSSVAAQYYCSSTNPQKVTITANSTASVSFTNKLNTGSLSLTKTTEDGKNLEGWKFSIYSDSACTSVVSGPHTTKGNIINLVGLIGITVAKNGM